MKQTEPLLNAGAHCAPADKAPPNSLKQGISEGNFEKCGHAIKKPGL
jgi:hypothetical protein